MALDCFNWRLDGLIGDEIIMKYHNYEININYEIPTPLKNANTRH